MEYFNNQLWNIVVTEPRKEHIVMTQLKPRFYEVYRPVLMLPVIVNGKGLVQYRPKPLFPAHLFVRKLFPDSPPIARLIGLNSFYRQMVGQTVIDDIKAEELKSYNELIPKRKPRLKGVKVGMNVSTLDGMISAVVTEVVDKERVKILFTFLNSEQTMVVSLDQLERTALP